MKLLATILVIAACLALILAPATSAWGEEGHRYINRVAAEHLPEEMPAFFRKSSGRLSFLGPEPDRWRDSRELFKALNEVNGPDHFINIDRSENFDALPNDRYLYSEWLRAKGKDAKEVGFLPYSILEGFQKVEVLFRLWRDPQHQDERDQIEQTVRWDANNRTAESKKFVAERLAAGSQMLANLWYTSWLGSATPSREVR